MKHLYNNGGDGVSVISIPVSDVLLLLLFDFSVVFDRIGYLSTFLLLN